MKNYAIILASGSGERSGLDIPKQFVKIGGKTVLEHTIDIFQKNNNIDEIIIVTLKNSIETIKNIVNNSGYTKVTKIAEGGLTRKDSSSVGINLIEDTDAKVLIHDAVRPFLSERIIDECISALDNYKAVDVAINSADTIIKVNENDIIDTIPQRKFLKRGQTPQGFDLKTIKKAHELAKLHPEISVTDDCGLILEFKLADIYVVKGDESNIKITYPIDVAIADKLFQLKAAEGKTGNLTGLKGKTAVIFGGTKGIGKSLFDLALKNGANAFAFSRTNGIDVTNPKLVAKALDEVYKSTGKIDYVINTAGILNITALNEKTYDEINAEFCVNYMGCVNVAKESFEYLKESKGSLMFYSSSSYTRGRKNYAIYSSSKAAVVNLTQALAEEWDEYGIRVNVTVPQRTATEMRYKNFGKEPLDTLINPEYVAEVSLNTILKNISGQVIRVNNNSKNEMC